MPAVREGLNIVVRLRHGRQDAQTLGLRAQAAALLGVSAQTVRRMVLHGHLIAWRPNPAGQKRLLYRRQVEDLAAHSQSRAIRQARLMQDTFDFF